MDVLSVSHGVEQVTIDGESALWHHGRKQRVWLYQVTASRGQAQHTRFVLAPDAKGAMDQAQTDLIFPQPDDFPSWKFTAVEQPLMVRGWGCDKL